MYLNILHFVWWICHNILKFITSTLNSFSGMSVSGTELSWSEFMARYNLVADFVVRRADDSGKTSDQSLKASWLLIIIKQLFAKHNSWLLTLTFDYPDKQQFLANSWYSRKQLTIKMSAEYLNLLNNVKIHLRLCLKNGSIVLVCMFHPLLREWLVRRPEHQATKVGC